ncbi:MAG: protoporphyrinogen oxidase [Planctomycetia bacterium]|nr:protoporphyrinogen oxidase [Planctomycetia bacterium]
MSGLVHDVVVVGGGLTGLATAWRVRRSGRSVVLLEAGPRVGGVVRTERVGGYRVERAAGTFPSSAAALMELHASLPAPPAIRTPDPATNGQFLWTGRGLVALPRNPPALFKSPLLTFGQKVRMIAEVTRGPRRVRTPESAHAFVRRRFGRAVADNLLRPMTLGIYGTPPEQIGMADAFPSIPEMERTAGSLLKGMGKRKGATKRAILVFEDGMEAFPRAIGDALGDALRLSSPVAALTPEGDVVRVTTEGGASYAARRVVLATTAADQARLVAPCSGVAAGILGAVRTVPMMVVAVGLPPGGSPPIPPAFGFLRGTGAKGRILGALFHSHFNPAVAPPGHALLNVFVGGGADPDAMALTDDEVRALVERDLATALGGPVRPDVVSVYRWAKAIPILAPGHRTRMAEAQGLLPPWLVLSGSHVTGVGVHACAAATA